MRKMHSECPDSDPPDRSVAADVILRQEPDGEEDEEEDKEFGQDSVLILRDGTELPSGGSAIGYTPGLEKRSLCGREA